MERLYDAATTPYDQVSNSDLFKPLLNTIQTIENSIQRGGTDAPAPAADAPAPAADVPADPVESEEKDPAADPAATADAGNGIGKQIGKAIFNKEKTGEDMAQKWSDLKSKTMDNWNGDCDGGVGSMVSSLFKIIFYIIVFPLLPWFYITKLSYQKLQQINTGITQPL